MQVLAGPAQAELTVQRSRFLGLLVPVIDPDAARSQLKEAKSRFMDATHVVHAFRTGREGSETCGCSDDGEPPGTAGRPVLDVLRGAGGGSALLLVVRWYGGIQLGTGGLVKAYSQTAKLVTSIAPWERARDWVLATISVEWSEHRPLLNDLVDLEAHVVEETFSSGVFLKAKVPAEQFDMLQKRAIDLTKGRTHWAKLN